MANPWCQSDGQFDGLIAANQNASCNDICLMKAGYLYPGQAIVGATCVGLFSENRDNTGGPDGGFAPQKRVAYTHGDQHKIFWLQNSTAGDAIAQADLPITVYAAGPKRVAKTDGGATRSICGTAVDIKDNGKLVGVKIAL